MPSAALALRCSKYPTVLGSKNGPSIVLCVSDQWVVGDVKCFVKVVVKVVVRRCRARVRGPVGGRGCGCGCRRGAVDDSRRVVAQVFLMKYGDLVSNGVGQRL